MLDRSDEDAALRKDEDEVRSFRLTAYEQCFAEKHHYDNLSWTIGAILLVFVGAILAYIPHIKPSLGQDQIFGVRELVAGFPGSLVSSVYLSMLVPRIILAAFACLILLLWYCIYQRNRIWAEVANQKIRDFERDLETEGIGIRFAKENASIRQHRTITLTNTDERGVIIAGYEKEIQERAQKRSMHEAIPWFLVLFAVLLLLASIVP